MEKLSDKMELYRTQVCNTIALKQPCTLQHTHFMPFCQFPMMISHEMGVDNVGYVTTS